MTAPRLLADPFTTLTDDVTALTQQHFIDESAPALAHTRFDFATWTDHGSVVGGDVPLGDRFDRVRLLGTGGAGAVYLALDREHGNRMVALKIVKPATASTAPPLLAEAQAAARMTHPNIVSVLDVGRLPGAGGVFIAFEYVEGKSLRALLQRHRPRPGREARVGERSPPLALADGLRILRDVASGLAAAHAADVLHLDVKPENVLVGVDGSARVLDFGLARLREGNGSDTCLEVHGAPTGTPAYMAPEVWAGEGVCDGTDVWSFAVVAYEVLTGSRPFAGDTPLDIASCVLTLNGFRAPPLDGIVDSALASLLRDALRRDRRARPYMRDLEAALARALDCGR